MRDGNTYSSSVLFTQSSVVSLPMRDGNQYQATVPYLLGLVVSLPMRDGNPTGIIFQGDRL